MKLASILCAALLAAGAIGCDDSGKKPTASTTAAKPSTAATSTATSTADPSANEEIPEEDDDALIKKAEGDITDDNYEAKIADLEKEILGEGGDEKKDDAKK